MFHTGKGEKNDSPGALEIIRGGARQCHNSGSSSSSLVMGKYTYFRKKRLVRKKVGSLSQCTVPEVAGVLKQPIDKLGDQEISGIMSKLVEAESVSPHVSEHDIVHFKAEIAKKVALPGIGQSGLRNDCASTRKISRRILRKSNSEIQSMTFLSTLCGIGSHFQTL